MFRSLLLTFVLVLAACGRKNIDRGADHPTTDHPPLPPASGTPIGYLLDNATQLKLSDDQLGKLKELDTSLAASDDEIDTQLRQIEKPEPEDPAEKGPNAAKRKPRNMAPGQNTVTTKDSEKLHQMRKQNDREALHKAYAILDKDQQVAASAILNDHGIETPTHAAPKPPKHDDKDGVPMEP